MLCKVCPYTIICFIIILLKKCYDNGVEEVVDHKTWCDADSSWFGMAKFAWSGY